MFDKSISLVLFGATGDLAKRKLLPALYSLQKEGQLPTNIDIIAIGRRQYTLIQYHEEVIQAISNFSRFKLDEESKKLFLEKVNYLELDYSKDDNFEILANYLSNKRNSQKIYYLAVSPEHFEPIVVNLKKYGLGETSSSHPRVVIEKPFGSNLPSAIELNNKIIDVFSEANTYRIDHYLGKEMMQNIMVIRFANLMFEPIWNNQFIKQIQINSSETIGIGTRGNFYESFGAIRDMVQSHLLQLVSLITMDEPTSLNNNDIRNEKIKILKSLRHYKDDEFKANVIRGQYKSYKNEVNVSSTSTTETFVALRLFVDNKRWEGVPIYLRTGKKMPRKSTEIIIEFKDVHNNLYPDRQLNTLVFKIQPEEGITVSFNAKKVGTTNKIIPVKMDFCQNCEVGFNSPEAYERLLYDVMRGDTTLFARWDEVEHSWKFIDSIIDYWKTKNPPLAIYEDNSWGPKEADELLEKDNNFWIDIYK